MRVITRRSCSLTLLLADDQGGWNVQALVCPRSRFREVRTSDEFSRPGVYVLDDESAIPIIYVGEGETTRPRLESHFAKKDFWTRLILFTSKDERLNKAHIKYLEARLLSLAREAKRSVPNNDKRMQLPSLASAEAAAMDVFLKDMLRICDLLGLTAFEGPPLLPLPYTPLPPRKVEGRRNTSTPSSVSPST